MKPYQLIGSRVWGGSTSTSDYDYIVTETHFNKIVKAKKIPAFLIHEGDYAYESSALFNIKTCKIKGPTGEMLNYIIYKDEHYPLAKRAADNVTLYSDTVHELTKRSERYKVCEQEFFRIFINNMETE